MRRLLAPKVKNYSFCARPKVFLSPGNSTCVTDIGRSVRVSRKLGRVGRSGRSVDVCPGTRPHTPVHVSPSPSHVQLISARRLSRSLSRELFVTANRLRRDVPRVTRRSAPSFSRLWTTCNNRKATASTDDQRDDASAERPASSMQVRKNLEPTCAM